MHEASPTEVAPNFITCSLRFIIAMAHGLPIAHEEPKIITEFAYHCAMAKNESRSQIHCAGVLFDLDGVLVDSTPAVARVWTKWALKNGFVPEDVVRQAHGRPSIATIRELLPHGDQEAEYREVERGEIEDVEGVVPLPGALELLRALPPDRWIIATSCTRALAEVRIRAAGLPVPNQLVTANDVVHGKPDPEPYLKAARHLGFAPAECVVIEDAPAGVRAGTTSGAWVLALRTTAADRELSESGATWIIDDLSSLQMERISSEGVTLTMLSKFRNEPETARVTERGTA